MLGKARKYSGTHLRKLRSEIRMFFRRNIYASIGENCLTDAVLARHGVKSITTPYSHARSNLDYVLQLEANNYAKFLAPECLAYEKFGDLTVVRNRYYSKSDPIYQEIHRNGFEFTHHDVIANAAHRESYQRKVSRMQKYKGKKNFILFYHYRFCEEQDFERIAGKLIELQKFYAIKGKFCQINVFTQAIVPTKEQRGLQIRQPAPGINIFVMNTIEEWSGSDGDLFWAKNDDDLLKEMLETVKKQIHGV